MKLDALLKKVASHESVHSPPPDNDLTRLIRRKKKLVDKFAHVRCAVDTRAPVLRPAPPLALRSAPAAARIQNENMMLLRLIRRNHFTRGRVDSRWRVLPEGSRQYHATRVEFSERTYADNRRLHRRLVAAEPRLTRTAELDRWWRGVERARARRGGWLLAPRAPRTDPAFLPPPGVVRPRVSLSLRIRGGASLGTLKLELFSEACPLTAAMFLALLPFYVGGRFHRKVPGLYWSGGAEACRTCAFPPENFHFPHSAPGLLTMQVSPDDEVTGIFSITFKPLPQFDLRSVVFGRVLPSRTFASLRALGAPLSSQPVVEVHAAARAPAPAPHRPAPAPVTARF